MITGILEWPSGKLDFTKGALIMGVLNVTPDSFSDGGDYFDIDCAVERGLKMVEQGAAMIDIGAESTRPGSESVSAEEQIRRAVPVIEALSQKCSVPISIDTYKVETARAALDAGAAIINDITALADEKMIELAVERHVPVILMHMQGTPQTMQKEPKYEDVVFEVLEYLTSRAAKAEQMGIAKNHIILDPGIGFGKTLEHNLSLMKHLKRFAATGYRVLLGTSRKSFLGTITGKENPKDRVFGTAATTAHGIAAGVSIFRVHDIDENLDVIKTIQAIE